MLKIKNLTKVYGDKKAVDNLSLHIRPGEIYGFIGHKRQPLNPVVEYYSLRKGKS